MHEYCMYHLFLCLLLNMQDKIFYSYWLVDYEQVNGGEINRQKIGPNTYVCT